MGYTVIPLHYWRQKTGSEGMQASWAFIFLCLVALSRACALTLQRAGTRQTDLQRTIDSRAWRTRVSCSLPWRNGLSRKGTFVPYFWLASDEVRRLAPKARDSRQWRRPSSPSHPRGSLGPPRVSSPKHSPLHLHQHGGDSL